MRDNTDILRELRGIYARGNTVIKCFKHCSPPVKTLLFKTYCTGMYGSQLWCDFNVTSLGRLKVAYNSIFRYLMNLDRRTSVSGAMIKVGVSPFNVTMRKYMANFNLRVYKSDNEIVNTLIESVHFNYSNLFRRWCSNLYNLKYAK